MSPEFVTVFLQQDRSLPDPDAVLGIDEEDSERTAPTPSVEDLLKDPDVKALVEVADQLQPAG